MPDVLRRAQWKNKVRHFLCVPATLGLMAASLPVGMQGGLLQLQGLRPGSQLQVVVSDLAPNLAARVEVRGPNGYRRAVAESEPLRHLQHGTYTVTAEPVEGNGGRYWPTPSDGTHSWKEVIRIGIRKKSVTVKYADFISDETKVVPDDATYSLSSFGVREERLKIWRPLSGQTYRDHEFLASLPTSADPDGYLVKVEKVESSPQPQLEVLDVVPATIEEAIPDGVIDAHRALTVENPLIQSRSLNCSTTATVSVSGELEVKPVFTFKARWGILRKPATTISIGVRESTSASATATGRVNCASAKPVLVWSSRSVLPHFSFVVFVGPVPIVITPTVSVYLSGTAEVTGGLMALVHQRADFVVRLRHPKEQNEEPHPEESWPGYSLESTATGHADAFLIPTAGFLLYGQAGPSVGVGVGLKVEANANRKSLELRGCLKLTGHLEIRPLKISRSADIFKERCHVIAQRSAS